MMDGHSILTGAQGVNVLTRSGYARMAAHSDFTIHGFALDNIHVIFPSPEVGVIGYTVREDVTVGGKRMTLNAADSSVRASHRGSDGRSLRPHAAGGAGAPRGSGVAVPDTPALASRPERGRLTP